MILKSSSFSISSSLSENSYRTVFCNTVKKCGIQQVLFASHFINNKKVYEHRSVFRLKINAILRIAVDAERKHVLEQGY